jgi:hypothetical protein
MQNLKLNVTSCGASGVSRPAHSESECRKGLLAWFPWDLKGLLAWFPWDLAIAVVRIVISVQNNGFTRLRSKIGNANFEIMGRGGNAAVSGRDPRDMF